MNIRRKIFILTAMILLLQLGYSHSGRTDKKGGHNDNVHGGYHFHHGMRAHDHPNGICELTKKKKKLEYVDNGNNHHEKRQNWGQFIFVGILGLGVGNYFMKKNKV